MICNMLSKKDFIKLPNNKEIMLIHIYKRKQLDPGTEYLANGMCKFRQPRAWQSSNKRCLPENKSRPPMYGSRIFASSEKSDARDPEPKCVWHENVPRAVQKPFQCGSAYE